mmetsp:Transcript_43225/g.113740  ORF Transcript_43225/g.113740 Transcript_43225/m.113740 type:complete len:137 (-) Transcript_43225:369-779(-)
MSRGEQRGRRLLRKTSLRLSAQQHQTKKNVRTRMICLLMRTKSLNFPRWWVQARAWMFKVACLTDWDQPWKNSWLRIFEAESRTLKFSRNLSGCPHWVFQCGDSTRAKHASDAANDNLLTMMTQSAGEGPLLDGKR